MYVAHSPNDLGEYHSLKEHLINVSGMMSRNSAKEEYKHSLSIAGLVHDFGKFQPKFQKYIFNGGARGSVPHAAIGAAFCKLLKQQEVAFVVDGHHKGLPNRARLQTDIALYLNSECDLLHDTALKFYEELHLSKENLMYDEISKAFKPTEREFFIRYMFSLLTDADWIDTEKHFSPENVKYRDKIPFDPEALILKLEQEIKSKSKEGLINKLRNELRQKVIEGSSNNPGFYSLTLPTGLGKTLTSLTWALHHAKVNNLKRVVIVLPFLSIIDQTAGELKRIFGDQLVLEHHSNIIEDSSDIEENISSEYSNCENYIKRFAVENWQYPIIITTTVQFFESLFSNKPSKCRKIHSLANAVVIFDEVQALPKELIEPTLTILKDMNKVIGTSFLFCTATQPAFSKREGFNGVEEMKPLIVETDKIFNQVKRVNYILFQNLEPVEQEIIVEQLLKGKMPALIILNTKRKAMQFFKLVKKETDLPVFHLSTNMYPRHRKLNLELIKNALRNNEKIIVVATQLVEAGVDFDFPVVLRELAPLESIIQAAGRCNREGRSRLGEVYIFRLNDYTMPDSQYRSLTDFAASMYVDEPDKLNSPDFFTEYYSKILKLFIDADRYRISEARKEFKFEDVAQSYRIIDTPTVGLFIKCYESNDLFTKTENSFALSRNDYRNLQQFTIQVYQNFIKRNFEKISMSKHGFWIWHGGYDKDLGLTDELNELVI